MRRRFVGVLAGAALAATAAGRTVPLATLDAAKDAEQVVVTEGTVSDVCTDDFSKWFTILMLQDGDCSLPVFLHVREVPRSVRFLGARVRVRGVYHAITDGVRRFSGPYLAVDRSSDLEIVAPAPPAFSEPELGSVCDMSPQTIHRLGRRRTSGRVSAVWGKGELLLVRRGAESVAVSLAAGVVPPACGEDVTVVGSPETDLYRVILSRAEWRPAERQEVWMGEPCDVTADQLLLLQEGERTVNMDYYGMVVRIRGVVRSQATPGALPLRMTVESDGLSIPVDLGTNPDAARDVPIGSEVEVTGVWIAESPAWSPWQPYPHVSGHAIVIRTAADLRVLSRPPWWTPARFLAVIVLLLAAICAVLVWNRVLQRMVARRGRALFKAQVAGLAADLRVGERTRLAVELHDALSQNLTGVACQLSAARSAFAAQAPTAGRHLDAAERMLFSSRQELRRCLWDLRGDTLEDPDFAAAIRRTVEPVCGGAELSVRFNVTRARLSDMTAHATLCIVRELAANAVRHGGARQIRIAGDLSDGVFSFSVRDDGRGFDPATAPGSEEGHFGLMGIRERVRRLGGRFELERLSGGGMRAAVFVALKPSEGMEGEKDV